MFEIFMTFRACSIDNVVRILIFQVPPPKDLSDNELIQLLESDDPTGFRIPMSIGEPHAELDKCKFIIN